MAAVEVASLATIAVTCVIAAVLFAVVFYIGFKSQRQSEQNTEINQGELELKPEENGQRKDKTKQSGKGKKGVLQLKSHRRQYAVLKGHTEHIFDLEFSLNGKYLASTSQGPHQI